MCVCVCVYFAKIFQSDHRVFIVRARNKNTRNFLRRMLDHKSLTNSWNISFRLCYVSLRDSTLSALFNFMLAKGRTPFEALIYELQRRRVVKTRRCAVAHTGRKKVQLSEAAEMYVRLLNAARTLERIVDACVRVRALVRRHYCASYIHTAGFNRGLSNESFAYYPALDRNARFR